MNIVGNRSYHTLCGKPLIRKSRPGQKKGGEHKESESGKPRIGCPKPRRSIVANVGLRQS